MSNCVFYVKNGFSLVRLLGLVYRVEVEFGCEGGKTYQIDLIIAEFLCKICYIKACGSY